MDGGLVAVLAYLIGSIPFSVILSKDIMRDDIRRHGSGNPGSSNMLRTFGIGHGILTFLLDMSKGILGALLGRWMAGDIGMMVGGVVAIIGHCWSIFIHFKGGKGAATAYGAMVIIYPFWTAISIVIFIGVLLLTGYASLGTLSTVSFVFVMVLILQSGNLTLVIATGLIVLLLVLRHLGNIQRLLNGTESKIRLPSKKR